MEKEAWLTKDFILYLHVCWSIKCHMLLVCEVRFFLLLCHLKNERSSSNCEQSINLA